MRNVVIANVNKLDFQTARSEVEVVEGTAQLTNATKTYVIDWGNYNGESLVGHTVFIPSILLSDSLTDGTKVYFDLECYPFFQKTKEVIRRNTKGIFRLRRIVENEDNTLIASDLYVLSTVFGDPESVSVKRSSAEVKPSHVIVMINFGGGTIAHLDYTFSGEDFIELEWSGINTIIEFNSCEMNPFEPKRYTSLPLSYSVEAIFDLSHTVDDRLVERLSNFHNKVNGGVQS
ncbi:hypothetical protein NC797_01225 [Aquibacillus sp. 3ASR75-11]|uniref:Uncharacterized protein n=1 Tax=Terrihalobacillus insolitus TaxID=2950438 RepID=A0A9X4AM38_9BACI|nr:hypothetical protein [Terrihalobacillus insolitus]MDC3412178.1 hypothetical protein [Terrihalobacillus insolitus]MDC3423128.1 hypothetical protein [Terrihalobacillus insolitus]